MTHLSLRFAALVVMAGALACAACSSDPTSSTPSASSGGSSAASPALEPRDCASRCETKVSGCGATIGQATELCGGVCDKAPTESQMACLEQASCAKGTSEAERACGIGAPSSSSGSPAPTPSSSPSKTECVDGAGQVRESYERYVCDCSDGIEFRGCAADPGDACRVFCGGTCKATCKPE